MSFLYLFRIFKYSELTSCNVIRCKIKTCIVIRNRWKVITSQILKQKLLLVCWPNLLLVRLVRLTFWPNLCIFSLFYQNNFGFTSLDILTSNIETLCAWELYIKKLMQYQYLCTKIYSKWQNTRATLIDFVLVSLLWTLNK